MSIRFDVEEGPVVDYVSPPNALNMEGQRSVVTSAFPDSNFECEYHFMYYFTMRNVLDYDALAGGSPRSAANSTSPLHAQTNHLQHRQPPFGREMNRTSPYRSENMDADVVPLKANGASVSVFPESSGKEKDLDASSASERFHSPLNRFSNRYSPLAEASPESPLSSSTPPTMTSDDGRWIGSSSFMRHSAGVSLAYTASVAEALERMEPKDWRETAAASAATATRVLHRVKHLRSQRLYGCAYYRQKRDPAVPRGSVQQVFVLLSSTPYHVLHELALRVIVSRLLQCCAISPDSCAVECSSALAPYPTRFFPSDPSFHPAPGADTAILDRAYLEMCCWPPPHPNTSYEVCLLHQPLSFVTPGHTARTNLFLGDRSSCTLVPSSHASRHTNSSSSSSRRVGKMSHKGGRLPVEASGLTRAPTSKEDATRGGVEDEKGHGLPMNDRQAASLPAQPLTSGRCRQSSNGSPFSPPPPGSEELQSKSSPLFSFPRPPFHDVCASPPPHPPVSLLPTSEAGGSETKRTPQVTLTLPIPLHKFSSPYSSPSSSIFSSTGLRLSSSTLLSSSSSLRRPYHGTLSATAGSHTLSSVIPLFALLHSHLDHLTRVWELLITHQPVCILSDTSACTAGVAHAISALIAPLLFTGKLYSHATSRHEDIERLRRLGKELPFSSSESVIVACTNRMLFKSFQAWPSWLIVLDEAFLPPPSLAGEGAMATLLQHASSTAVRRHRQQSNPSKHSSFHNGKSPPPAIAHRHTNPTTTSRRNAEEEEDEAGPLYGARPKAGSTALFFPVSKPTRPSRVSTILFTSLDQPSASEEGGRGEAKHDGRTTQCRRDSEADASTTAEGGEMGKRQSSSHTPPRLTAVEGESTSSVTRSGSATKWMASRVSLAPSVRSSWEGSSSAGPGTGGRRGGQVSRQGWSMEMEDWEGVPEYTIDSSSADSLSASFSSLSSPRQGIEAEREVSERGRETLPFVSTPMKAVEIPHSPLPEKVIHRASPSFGADRMVEQLLSSAIGEGGYALETSMERGGVGSPTRHTAAMVSSIAHSRHPSSAADHLDKGGVDPLRISPPSSSGEAAYYFHSGFTAQTLKKVLASQVPALLGPLSSLEGPRVEHSQQCSSNYFDASYSFVLDHTMLRQSLQQQLEKISGLDATSQALTISLQLDQLYAGWSDGPHRPSSGTEVEEERHCDPVSSHSNTHHTKAEGEGEPPRDRLDETLPKVSSESAMSRRFGASLSDGEVKEMEENKSLVADHPILPPPLGLKEFSASTVFSQQSVADVTLRRFFRSLTLEFLRPVDVWFSEELQRTSSILEWCDGKRGSTVLTSAQFMQFIDQNHRRVIGTSIKGKLSYASYQGIYEKFSKGVLFYGYLQQLIDRKIREELAQFSLESWLQLYPSEDARRSQFFALLQLIIQEMEEVIDSDVEFVHVCLGILQQMASTPAINKHQEMLEDFAAKWGDFLSLSNEM